MRRIICIGNRYDPRDAAGPMVYDHLLQAERPREVEVIDGGLAGLNLFRFVDGADRVVFVDALMDGGWTDRVVLLDPVDVVGDAGSSFGHSAGLDYFLRMLPIACDGPLPEIAIVGICCTPDPPTVQTAADLALEVALDGPGECRGSTGRASRRRDE